MFFLQGINFNKVVSLAHLNHLVLQGEYTRDSLTTRAGHTRLETKAVNQQTKKNELLSGIQEIFEVKIPFNQIIGMKVELMDPDKPRVRFEMRDDLVGNYHHGILHGGVTASVIDVTGGLVAFLSLQQKLEDDTVEKRLEKFGRLSTIDMRVDYLRPGLGRWFVATGYILRTGKKVAVTRVEMHDEKGHLFSVGTCAYIIA